jgi:hypothetical protein
MLVGPCATGKSGFGFSDVLFKRHGEIKRMQPEPATRQILKREGAGCQARQRAKSVA